jgi:hypothetical protein
VRALCVRDLLLDHPHQLLRLLAPESGG